VRVCPDVFGSNSICCYLTPELTNQWNLAHLLFLVLVPLKELLYAYCVRCVIDCICIFLLGSLVGFDTGEYEWVISWWTNKPPDNSHRKNEAYDWMHVNDEMNVLVSCFLADCSDNWPDEGSHTSDSDLPPSVYCKFIALQCNGYTNNYINNWIITQMCFKHVNAFMRIS
jgi:hypothetical protein